MDWIEKGIEIAAAVLELLDLQAGHLLGPLLALPICWGSTQSLKVVFNLGGRIVTIMAFLIASFICFAVTPPEGFAWSWTNFGISLAAGLAGPFAYKWLKEVATKRDWALAKAMAADEAKQKMSTRRR